MQAEPAGGIQKSNAFGFRKPFSKEGKVDFPAIDPLFLTMPENRY